MRTAEPRDLEVAAIGVVFLDVGLEAAVLEQVAGRHTDGVRRRRLHLLIAHLRAGGPPPQMPPVPIMRAGTLPGRQCYPLCSTQPGVLDTVPGTLLRQEGWCPPGLLKRVSTEEAQMRHQDNTALEAPDQREKGGGRGHTLLRHRR